MLLGGLASALCGPARAQEPSKAYIDQVSTIEEIIATAMVVSQTCQMRSHYWYESLAQAMSLAEVQLDRRMGVQPWQFDALRPRLTAQIQHIFSPATCRTVRENGQLDKLDQLQWSLTGGYH